MVSDIFTLTDNIYRKTYLLTNFECILKLIVYLTKG